MEEGISFSIERIAQELDEAEKDALSGGLHDQTKAILNRLRGRFHIK